MNSSSLSALFLALLALLSPLGAGPVKFLAWDDDVALRKIGFSDGKEVTELQELHPQKRSKSISWTAGDAVPQLIALDRKTPEGKPVGVPIKLTAGMESPLVLILPDKSHPSGLRSFVIEDSSTSFGWGTLRFLNATGKELLVREDKLIKALPANWKAVDIDPGGKARNLGIQMAAKSDLESVLYSAVWEHNPDVRKLIIVVPGTDARTGALDLKIIPEDRRTVSVPAAPEPAVEIP